MYLKARLWPASGVKEPEVEIGVVSSLDENNPVAVE